MEGVNEASHDELHSLGRAAARQRPAHETRKYKPVDRTVPREARIGFAIGGALLVICIGGVVAQKIMNRPAAPAGTAAPAIQATPAQPAPPKDD